MNLIAVDIGNSNSRFARFQDGQLITIDKLENFQPTADEIVIISNVRKEIPIAFHFNLEHYKKKNYFFEMPFHYSEKLGIDRLIVAYSVFLKLQKKTKTFKALIIDAGTFITIDTITENGFMGGFIFPGLTPFLASYQKGELLPLAEFQFHNNLLEALPSNTEIAMTKATQVYLESILEKLILNNHLDKIMITGGTCNLIEKIISKFNLAIEIEVDSNWLLQSMHMIYDRHLKD